MNSNSDEITSQVYTQNINDATRWSVLSLASITVVYAYFGWELHAWQFYLASTLTGLGTAVAALNFIPSLTFSPRTRINLLLLSTEIVIVLEMLLLQGLGWILALTIVLVSTMILIVTMQKPDRKLVLRSLLLALLTIIVDFFGPAYRLSVQGLFLWEYVYVILIIVFGIAFIYNFGWNIRDQSLRTRLITTFGFVAMIIIFGVAYFFNWSENNLLQSEEHARLKQQAQMSATFVSVFLQNELDHLAELSEHIDLSSSPTELNKNFESLRQLLPSYNDFWIVSANDTFIAGTTDNVPAAFPIGVPTMRGPNRRDGPHQFLLAVPIWNESKTAVSATLIAGKNLAPMFATLRQNQNASAQLITPDGIISPSDSSIRFQQTPLSEERISTLLTVNALPAQVENSENPELVQSVAAVEGETAVNNLNWYILIEQPASQISIGNNKLENSNIFIGMAGAVIFFLIAVYFSNQIVRPIHQLTNAATRITSGDFSVQIDIDSNNEIGVLANSFNNMTRQLQGHVSELEKRVQERTAALSYANTQLAGSELRYRALTTLVTDFAGVLLLKSGKLSIDWLSEHVQTLLGDIQNFPDITSRFEAIILPEDIPAGREMFEKVLAGQKSSVELRLNVIPEQTIWLQVYAQSFAIEGNPAERKIYIVGQDITQPRQAQIALNQAERLHSLGVLAGGIAHDFNNLLTGILGQASLVKIYTARNRPIEKNLNSMIKAAERAADITQKLLAYAGKGRFELQTINLYTLLSDNYTFLQTLIPAKVRLSLDEHTQPNISPYIEADPGQIQQVVMNLILNAANACTGSSGQVNIKTESLTVTKRNMPPALPQTPLSPGPYHQLVIQDNGHGIKPDNLNKVFEPFFTTRKHGRGLGLSATLGIIQAHHGGLHVVSQPNEGTTFTIYLPAAMPPKSTAAIQTNRLEPIDINILVIDDEQWVREVVEDGLSMKGYTIITAHNGQEGLEKYQMWADNLHLILVDMQMPVMGGIEFLQHLRTKNTQMKVIFSSGYSEAEVDSYLQADKNLLFLQKPYTIEVLSQIVEQALSDNNQLR